MFEKGFFLASPIQSQLILALAVVLFLLAFAVMIEVYRRRRERRLQRAAEWRAVRKIADEKELTEEERYLLESVIQKYAPEAPLRTATSRQEFDRCIERDIAETAQTGGIEAIEVRGALLRDIRMRIGLDYVPFGQRIHSTRELYRDQTIWISPGKGASSSNWYRMSVSYIDEARFHLCPHEGVLPGATPAGSTIRCRMYREEDARYTFEGVVSRVETQPPTLVLPHVNMLNRLQSRAHFRIHFEQIAYIDVLSAPVDDDMTGVESRPAVTRFRGRFTSLSGGGFAVIAPQPLPKQVLLRVHLEIGHESGPVPVVARLVAASPLSAGNYLVRAAYVAMSEEIRERIAHFVFHRQTLHRNAEENAAQGDHAP